MRIVTALVTWGIASAAGMSEPSTELPGGDVAAWNAEAHGFVLASVSGGSVVVSPAGAVTLTVVAMAAPPERGGGGQAGKCPPTCGAPMVRKGQEGEAAVRAVEDIGEKSAIFVNGRRRIPDGINQGVGY